MEVLELANKLNRIRDETIKLLTGIQTLKNMGFTDFPESYEKLSVDIALRAEHIACSMRHMVFTSGFIRKSDYMKQLVKTIHVNVKKIDMGICIEIPGLLPKKRVKKNNTFLTDPLYYALEQFDKENKVTRYSNCVIVFQHIYNNVLPQKHIRDYDNIETKQVLDVINAFLLKDDNGSEIDLFHTSKMDTRDCTRIFIIEKKHFPTWLMIDEPIFL